MQAKYEKGRDGIFSADDAENDGNSEDWYVSSSSPSYIHIIYEQHFQSCGNSLKSQKLAICLSSTNPYHACLKKNTHEENWRNHPCIIYWLIVYSTFLTKRTWRSTTMHHLSYFPCLFSLCILRQKPFFANAVTHKKFIAIVSKLVVGFYLWSLAFM